MRKLVDAGGGGARVSRALLAASAGIPEQVVRPDYYFSAINTPFWIWAFRILLLLGAAFVFFAYRYFSRSPGTPDEPPKDKEKTSKE